MTITPDLRERPPRPVNLFTRISLLFGGFYFQFGSFFFWFGLIFTIVFVGDSPLVNLFSFDGKWVKTQGVVIEIEETNASVNDEPIYAYRISYAVDGVSYESECKDTWKNGYEQDKLVDIEYRSKNPQRGRIVGMSNHTFPIWVMFVLLFPLVGLWMMWIGFRKNIDLLDLVKNGHFTRGTYKTSRATNTSINEQTVYEYEFEFSIHGGSTYTATCKTHLTDRVEDEEREKILYDPHDPKRNIVYDAYTNMPSINKDGSLKQHSILAVRFLFSTIFGLLINSAVYFGMYG